MKTIDYLKKVKECIDISSDYALAKKLGVTKQTISGYMNGSRVMDDYIAAKVADVLKINPLRVIAEANAEREKDSQKAEFWRKLASGAQGAVLGSALVFSGLQYTTQVIDNSTIYTLCVIACLICLFLFFLKRKHEEKEVRI
jgi:transcriptional regulator with XRE-family HTH domain